MTACKSGNGTSAIDQSQPSPVRGGGGGGETKGNEDPGVRRREGGRTKQVPHCEKRVRSLISC